MVEDTDKLRECASSVNGGFQVVPDAVNRSLSMPTLCPYEENTSTALFAALLPCDGVECLATAHQLSDQCSTRVGKTQPSFTIRRKRSEKESNQIVNE